MEPVGRSRCTSREPPKQTPFASAASLSLVRAPAPFLCVCGWVGGRAVHRKPQRQFKAILQIIYARFFGCWERPVANFIRLKTAGNSGECGICSAADQFEWVPHSVRLGRSELFSTCAYACHILRFIVAPARGRKCGPAKMG